MKLYEVVVLLEDVPELGLVRGNTGTIVESWGPGSFEVEFVAPSGETYALARLAESQLLPLRDVPAQHAS